MGIHGLSYFIKSFPTLLEKAEWSASASGCRDHFIIDGNAFVYHIAFQNRTNWTHGGQYSTIAQIVEETMAAFRNAGIQTTFLFDGSLPQDKLETRIKRHKSYIERSVTTYWNLKQINASNKDEDQQQNGIQYYGDLFLIPPLTLEVVIQTLRELEVEVIICQGEADSEVVALAEEKNAYIVSQDSDMHVYPRVGKGYIPLDLLQIPTPEQVDTVEVISAGVFRPEKLASMLYLDIHLLPLFGTLLGNDYLDVDLVRYSIGQWCSEQGIQMVKNQNGWPKIVAEFIRRNCTDKKNAILNVVDQLKPIISKSSMKSREEKATGFEDRIIESIRRYDCQSPLLVNSDSGMKNHAITSITNKVLSGSQHYGSGYSRQIMDVIESKSFWTSIFVEDVEREFSWDVSLSLRQGLYGSVSKLITQLNQETNESELQEDNECNSQRAESDHQNNMIVEEYVREKHHLEVLHVTGGVIQEHNEIDNDTAKKSLTDFYQFHISNGTRHIDSFDSQVHPLILCLRYMIYHCSRSIENGRLYNYEVIAIIISTLRSLAPTLGYANEEVPNPSLGMPTLKKRSIHLSAQYQSIIYSSYLLSQILDVPGYLQQPHVLSHMFNGLYFHFYMEAARGGASIGKMLSGVSAKFSALFCSVYKSVMIDLYSDVHDVFDYDIISSAVEEWTISDNKPKRLNSTKKSSSNRPEKKKKSNSGGGGKSTNGNRSTNAFNVLSFGCNFDE